MHQLKDELRQRVRSIAETRHGSTRALVACYLLPLLFQALIAVRVAESGPAWTLFSLGLCLALCGSVPLYMLLREWEAKSVLPAAEPERLPTPAPYTAPAETPSQGADTLELFETIDQLSAQLGHQEELCTQLAKERSLLQKEVERLEAELDRLESEGQGAVQHRDALLNEHKQTINEQRSVIERKQDYILKLENKVRDLSYEVKTLIQLNDESIEEKNAASERASDHPVLNLFDGEIPALPLHAEPSHPGIHDMGEMKVQTAYDASLQLQKCIDTARRLTGATHLSGTNGRLLDLSSDSYAIDLRRLFDSYNSESACPVFLYSKREDKLLFVNPQITSLLGWSPDKFTKDYPSLVTEGWTDWKRALKEVTADKPQQMRLLMKTKSGDDLLTHCNIGMIPNGAFAGHLVGVIYAG
ncbi:MAG: hypothetical protein KDK78_03015 [Chlamydiia bacterium]|nr:hypothetical protein [Chlamydiia bacterium]